MWLTSSSVGRKFIMALTGACLVLFVTFHCLMNSVAIIWPTAYNVICEFLGANWYALAASMGLAVLFIIHICYALWLTLQNRKARGNDRYSISRRPAAVEWSSQNMLVLGIVVVAFLVVHLIQFWAKMQLVEIRGVHDVIPPAAGTLFIQEAFALIWTPIVYIIGFVALWFHLNHGFWSMFQSVGWDSTVWIPRLKKIGAWWTTIVIALFVAQAIVFTVRANEKYYLHDADLQRQYYEMSAGVMTDIFGPGIEYGDFDQLRPQVMQIAQMAPMILPQAGEKAQSIAEGIMRFATFNNYLFADDQMKVIDTKPLEEYMKNPNAQPQMPQMMAPQPQAMEQEEAQANPADQAAAEPADAQAPAEAPANESNTNK